MLGLQESPAEKQPASTFTRPGEAGFKQPAPNLELSAKDVYKLLLNYSDQNGKNLRVSHANYEKILLLEPDVSGVIKQNNMAPADSQGSNGISGRKEIAGISLNQDRGDKPPPAGTEIQVTKTNGGQVFNQASNNLPGHGQAVLPTQGSKAQPLGNHQQPAWQQITNLSNQSLGNKLAATSPEIQAVNPRGEQTATQPTGSLIDNNRPGKPTPVTVTRGKNSGNFQQSTEQVPDSFLNRIPKNESSPFNTVKTVQAQTTAREIINGQDNLLNQQNQQLSFRTFTPTIQFEGNSNNSLLQPVQMAARMASVIQQAVTDSRGATTLRIKLKPEHLGEITVRLVYNQGNLQAHFIAASAHTRELLEQSMGQLRENLAQLNINLNDTSTSPGHDGNDGWTGQYQQNQYSQGQFRQGQFNTPDRQTPFKAPGQPAGEDMPAESPITTETVNINHLV